jgi:hypothetical protein
MVAGERASSGARSALSVFVEPRAIAAPTMRLPPFAPSTLVVRGECLQRAGPAQATPSSGKRLPRLDRAWSGPGPASYIGSFRVGARAFSIQVTNHLTAFCGLSGR